MKTTFFLLHFLLLLLILTSLFLSGCSQEQLPSEISVEQQTQMFVQQEQFAPCPRGIENDPYPGMCYLYDDQNNNGLCDLGE